MARLGGGGDAQGRAVVDDPVCAGGEERLIGGGGANGEDAGACGFARARARGRVFDDNAILRGKMNRGSTFQIRLRVWLAALDVAGGDEMRDVLPEAGGTQTYFGERARSGGDDGELRRGNCSEQIFGAGKGDDVGDIFDFGALHPAVFFQVDFGAGVREKFLDRGEAGAAMRELNDVVGIHVVLECPASPDAGDGGSGINEDAVHVDE